MRMDGAISNGGGIAVRFRIGDYLLPRFAEALDSKLHNISSFQVLRRLHPESHACWRSCADHIPRKQGHEFADIRNQGGDVENHVAGRTVLAKLSIDLEPHF